MNETSAAKIFVIIPSAGASVRMGAGRPKVFREILGRTVIERTLEAVGAGLPGAIVVVAGRPEYREDYERTFGALGIPAFFAAGGATRQESVGLALNFIAENCSPGGRDIVLVHDAARCLASPELFRAALAAGREYGAATAAVPVVDTLLLVDDDSFGVGNIDRSGVFSVQTPQVFHWSIISEAHAVPASGATDDASLAARLHKVRIFPGERTNIKITTPEDMDIAVSILRK